jgi:hypothetical protein
MIMIDKMGWHMREHHEQVSSQGSRPHTPEPIAESIISPKSGLQVEDKKIGEKPNFLPNILNQNQTQDGGLNQLEEL